MKTMDQEKQKPILIALIGMLGAGKSTLAKYLKNNNSFTMFITGDAFRDAASKDTPDGRTIKKLMSKRLPLPVPLIREIVENNILAFIKAGARNIVIDGVPRSYDQYELLKEILPDCIFVHLSLPTETALARLAQAKDRAGRGDSNNKKAKIEGVKVFQEKIFPLIKLIEKNEGSKFCAVDATSPVDIVARKLLTQVASI